MYQLFNDCSSQHNRYCWITWAQRQSKQQPKKASHVYTSHVKRITWQLWPASGGLGTYCFSLRQATNCSLSSHGNSNTQLRHVHRLPPAVCCHYKNNLSSGETKKIIYQLAALWSKAMALEKLAVHEHLVPGTIKPHEHVAPGNVRPHEHLIPKNARPNVHLVPGYVRLPWTLSSKKFKAPMKT